MVDTPSDQEDLPEIRIGRRVIQKYNLTPPVAVETLADTLMEIHVASVPVKADALMRV